MFLFPFPAHTDIRRFRKIGFLTLKRVTENMRKELFGVKNLTYHEGRVNGYKLSCIPSLFDPPRSERTTVDEVAISWLLLQSDLICLASIEDASRFNYALRVYQLSRSGLIYGVQSKATIPIFPNLRGRKFFNPRPFSYYLGLPCLNSVDLPKFKRIYEILDLSNKKQGRILKRYCQALSIDSSLEDSFVDLCTVLEMLYLPQTSQELNFRASLRCAKVLETFYSEDVGGIFELVKKIYGFRSSVVHTGCLKKKSNDNLINIFKKAADIVRRSIILYLERPSEFTEEALNKICLN